MKKILILLICLIMVAPVFADVPSEFDPWQDGEGKRVLIIDDFNGYWDNRHGEKMEWIVYDGQPLAYIERLDFTEAVDYKIEEDFDLILCFIFFDTVGQVHQYLPDEILNAHSIKLAPAGNGELYTHDNSSDEWFILVGAEGHEDWRQGEMLWKEDGTYNGSCGATASFAVQVLKMMEKPND